MVGYKKPRSNRTGFLAFKIFFGIVLTLILAVWGVTGFTIYKAYTCPECAGQMVGSFYKGVIDSSGVKELLPTK